MDVEQKLIYEFAKHDNQKSFTEFFNIYYSRLHRFAINIVKSELLAEEIVLDVFVKVWKNRIRIVEIENVSSYLFRSVRNQSLSCLKKRKVEFEPFGDNIELSYINTAHPENELIDKELFEKANTAINKLPPKCKLIFTLCRDDGFNYEEVADILEVSKSTVKNQMTIALKKIRKELSTYFSSPEDQKYNFLMSILIAL
jgi:RNA polymerase sigma-70 factor (family 1)